jgi:hypothetical protein
MSLSHAMGGLLPGVGEYQDVEMLVSRGSTKRERALAAGSLLLNLVTLGEAPNASMARRAVGSVDTHTLQDLLTAQKYTHQIDVLPNAQIFSQIDTFNLPPSGGVVYGPGRVAGSNAVAWIDEGGNLRAGKSAGMSDAAYNYQSGAVGARSNATTGRSQAPLLTYTDNAGQQISVKFDGGLGSTLVDRKMAIHTGAKTRSLAQRQSAALTEHGLKGIWEVPNAKEAARAVRLLTGEGITNITVKVVSP